MTNRRSVFIFMLLLLGGVVSKSYGQKVTRINFDSIPIITPGKNGVPLPKITRAEKPTITPYYSSGRPAGTPIIIKVDTNELIVNTPGQNGVLYPEKINFPSTGFVISNNDTIHAPEITQAKRPRTIPAQEFRHKDNSIYDIQYLDVDQGLPNSHIHDIVIDDIGNLWFASYEGELIRYDGRTYYAYGEGEGLGGRSMRKLHFDSKGNLWIGTNDGGIKLFDGNSFTTFNEKTGLGLKNFSAIHEDSRGNMWFGSSDGLFMYDGKSFTQFTVNEGLVGNVIYSIAEDKEGNIWLGTKSGISRYNYDHFVNYDISNGLIDNDVNVLLVDKLGRIWVGTKGGLSIYNEEAFTSYTSNEGLKFNDIKELFEDENGAIWIGTDGGGISVFEDNYFKYIGTQEGLTNNRIRSIVQDKTNNIWIATYGGGVCRFKQNSFMHLTSKQGLVESLILNIIEDKEGKLWMASLNKGLSIFDGQTFTTFRTITGKSNVPIWSLLEDRNGDKWLGTQNGISKFDGENFTTYTEQQGLINNQVYTMMEDSKGNLWFGTFRGASKFDGQTFTNFNENHGLQRNLVLSITEDTKGNIWFGTYGGVSKFDGASITSYKDDNGIANNIIRKIFEDNSEDLWIGTDGGAVKFQYEEKGSNKLIKKKFGTEDGLPNKGILSIVEDYKNRIWVGTEGGIAVVSNNKDEQKIHAYKQLDGLLNGLDVVQNAVCIDKGNRIWWGMGKGVTSLDLNNFSLPVQPPTIQLNELDINSERVNFNYVDSLSEKHIATNKYSSSESYYNYPLDLELAYDNNHLTFHYSAIDWVAPHKIKYQYKLEGLDEAWSNITEETKADYRNIPHGTFTFKVKAIGAADKWSETFEYSFVVNPPWWLTWWAYLLFALFAVGIVYIIILANSYRLKQLNLQLEQTVASRTEELKTSNEKLVELNASKDKFFSIISHDLKEPIYTISEFTDLLEDHIDGMSKEEIQAMAAELSKSQKNLYTLLENLLEWSRSQIGLLDFKPGKFDITELIDNTIELLEPQAKKKNISLVNKSVKALHVNAHKNSILTVIRNLVSNAIKFTNEHGEIILHCEKNEEKVIVSVTDNGVGMSDEIIEKIFRIDSKHSTRGTANEKGTGLGLVLCKEFVEKNGGRIWVKSKKEEGSKFYFSLPLI